MPFRLTRMMVQAMEVSGIEGNFRWAHSHCSSRYRDQLTKRVAAPQQHVFTGGCVGGLKQDKPLGVG